MLLDEADEDKKLEQLRLSKARDAPREDGKVASKEEESKVVAFSFEDDPGSNNSGFYELQGVITHKGRSSNSGHYVGWVRIEGDRWAMCDDDDVQPVSSEDVLRLSGGGDWHCAYLLLYGPRILRN
uniref:ubiquitinyl hydrolase 1 n=1 Tax=Parascaris equorum TaxID=6256 RepID=A0A914RDW6_PAREQ